jgi:hypothetical protein
LHTVRAFCDSAVVSRPPRARLDAKNKPHGYFDFDLNSVFLPVTSSGWVILTVSMLARRTFLERGDSVVLLRDCVFEWCLSAISNCTPIDISPMSDQDFRCSPVGIGIAFAARRTSHSVPSEGPRTSGSSKGSGSGAVRASRKMVGPTIPIRLHSEIHNVGYCSRKFSYADI